MALGSAYFEPQLVSVTHIFQCRHIGTISHINISISVYPIWPLAFKFFVSSYQENCTVGGRRLLEVIPYIRPALSLPSDCICLLTTYIYPTKHNLDVRTSQSPFSWMSVISTENLALPERGDGKWQRRKQREEWLSLW